MPTAQPSVDHVIVLIAAPGKAEVSDEVLAETIGTVAMFNPELRWLEETGRTAAEVAFTPPPPSHFHPASLESRLRGRLMGLAIDLAVLPLGGRRRKLLLSDLPEDTAGADVLVATMHAHAGQALLNVSTPLADAPPPEEVLAVVQHATALPLFEQAGLKVAFHADEAVARTANARLWHNDLTALLYLQGYRHADFHQPA